MAFERLNHNTLSKQVVRAIRHQIFSGALKPNQRVVEAEIAAEMGISRGPVREAIAELEKEGLIITYARKGTYVKSFELKDIEEIYTLRALLEGFAVTLAIDRLQGPDLDYLKDLLDQIGKMAEKKDVIEVSRLNMQFHKKIMELSDHKRLYDYLAEPSGPNPDAVGHDHRILHQPDRYKKKPQNSPGCLDDGGPGPHQKRLRKPYPQFNERIA